MVRNAVLKVLAACLFSWLVAGCTSAGSGSGNQTPSCSAAWPPTATAVTTSITNSLALVTTGSCTVYLSVSLTGGSYYYLEWDDSFQGTGNYTGDSVVTIYDSAGNAITDVNVYPQMDSAWSTMRYFQPSATGVYYIGIDAFSSSDTGTTGFRIYDALVPYTVGISTSHLTEMYLTNSNRSILFEVTLTGSTAYNFRWDDSLDGTGTYTANALVDLWDSVTMASVTPGGQFAWDSGWTTPGTYTPASTKIYYLRFTPFIDASSVMHTGTAGFRIY